SDGLGADADDLAELADHHDLRLLVHQHDGNNLAVTRGRLNVDDALAAARLQTVFIDVRALAVTLLRNREDEARFLLVAVLGLPARLGGDRHANDVVAFAQVHASNAMGLATHWPYVLFIEANRLAIVRRQENDLAAVGTTGGDQFVLLLDGDGVDANRPHVAEVLQRRLLHRPAARGEGNVLALFFEVAHGKQRPHALARLQRHQVGDGFALAGGAQLGKLVYLEPIHAARVADRDRDLLVRDQVFQADLGGFVLDDGTARVAVFLLDFLEFLDNEATQFLFAGEDR